MSDLELSKSRGSNITTDSTHDFNRNAKGSSIWPKLWILIHIIRGLGNTGDIRKYLVQQRLWRYSSDRATTGWLFNMRYSICQQLVHQDLGLWKYWVILNPEQNAWAISISNLAQDLSKGQSVEILEPGEKIPLKESSIIFVAMFLSNNRNVVKGLSSVRFLLENSTNNAAIVNSATKILNCRFATVKTDHLSFDDMSDWATLTIRQLMTVKSWERKVFETRSWFLYRENLAKGFAEEIN